MSEEKINHPKHYGGGEYLYEAIKVIEAWGLNFSLGSALKYIQRHGKKAGEGDIEDLRKAAWYITREADRREAIAKQNSRRTGAQVEEKREKRTESVADGDLPPWWK